MSALTNMTTSDRSWNAEQQNYWSDLTPQYDDLYRSRWSELENQWVAARLRFLGDLPASPSVLDLGCGTGLGAKLALEWTDLDRFVGVDITPDMARVTSEAFGVQTHVGAMDELNWVPSETIDAVICLFSAASFVSNPDRLFREISRVLKPGGRAHISTLGRDFLGNPNEVRFRTRGHRSPGSVPARRFRPKHLRHFATKSGLDVEKVEGMNALSGICEAASLWHIGRLVARMFPATSHLIETRCVKPTKDPT
jgi:SAM-dependent methyltransferase